MWFSQKPSLWRKSSQGRDSVKHFRELLLFTLSDPSQSLPTPRGSILPDWPKGPLRPPNHSLVYPSRKRWKLNLIRFFGLVFIWMEDLRKLRWVMGGRALEDFPSGSWQIEEGWYEWRVEVPSKAGLLISSSSAATRPPNTNLLPCIQIQIQEQIQSY